MRLFNLKEAPKAIIDSAPSALPVKVKKAEGDEPAELLLMEQIGEDWWGDGIAATDVADFVRDQKGHPINVRINSPGGFVYDGMVMYNALASHDAQVTVTIEGLAYSMASVIAMAGDVVKMFKASDFGIHRAWGLAIGNQKDMRAEADWLAKIDQHLIEIYVEKTGKEASQIEKWMDGESDGTLFNAVEAKEAGFADEVIDPKNEKSSLAKAKSDLVRSASKGTVHAARRRLAMAGIK